MRREIMGKHASRYQCIGEQGEWHSYISKAQLNKTENMRSKLNPLSIKHSYE